ncbi:MAG: hypothetical protein Q7N50_08690 [Armatimonadota bacterium]|nr:hypothetical protein [Armatimonadota bacterium]
MAESSIQRLKERINKLLHQKDMASQKAKMLEEQTTRDRQREETMNQFVQQLMDRHRELNIMLNRANLMLNRAQDANAILSLEFTELCHALPAPEDSNVKDRIRRINDLFKNTGIADAEMMHDDPHNIENSVIVTPPPHEESTETPKPQPEPIPVEVAAYEVVEDEFPPNGEPAQKDSSQALEDLYRRTGDDTDSPLDEPFIDTPSSPEPASMEPASPVQEPEPEPATVIQEQVFIDSEEEFAQPVATGANAEPEPALPRERRWWQMLGRR